MRPRLLIVWCLLAMLLGAIALHEATGLFAPDPPQPPTGTIPMFAFGEPDLGQVEIIYRGQSAVLMRDPNGLWFQHGAGHRHGGGAGASGAADGATPDDVHASDPEQAAKIAEQLAVTTRMLADRRVEPEQGLDAYGLFDPQAVFLFYGRRGDQPDYGRPLDVLYVGDLLPTEYAYYTMRDGDDALFLVPRYQIALMLALAFGEAQAPSLLPSRPSAATD
jgi:hypothetical protein